ncbi:hypothetical protein K2173_007497 [Erythroxylum novogranatense]|uniref:Uncharacterized protein n=1 Tax=Erythroxylum novogranatense TaxID=1862640 RepID=A0AAV8T7Q1_9ROSI|nr:hypothetical protein K2173_007497 [Erythroxylum novogranatense]
MLSVIVRILTFKLVPILLESDIVTLIAKKLGQEDYDRLRPLSYPQTDVFILAFSLISKASYENVAKKWIPELRHHAPRVPVILVGTKLDLREDKQFVVEHPGAVSISTAQGEELRKLIGAAAYIECSSKTQQNVKAVFDAAINVILPPRNKVKQTKMNIINGLSLEASDCLFNACIYSCDL